MSRGPVKVTDSQIETVPQKIIGQLAADVAEPDEADFHGRSFQTCLEVGRGKTEATDQLRHQILFRDRQALASGPAFGA